MNKKLKRGFIQIYTGNGKGKTTAAIGQAVRAAGAGLKSYILQLMKEFPYSELESLKKLSDLITIEQVGNDKFVYKKEKPSNAEIEKVKHSLNKVKEKMLSGQYDIIILDEICVSIYFGLVTTKDVLFLIDQKPPNIELILTGRYCPEELIEKADLVTEMTEIKHYYQKGISTRKGIES
ncbi:cob(I)yrinic acid a,c-diamide adenosyltransferase [Melioribacteraceae bacterium 4301-Me]|uniref:cob(I)yrinic acid a,c-diamide adenosyltransferase n=1 Tax=Pyranulibacter aquaticus TaxID=3163344 RepID=UPI0035987A08